MLLTRRSFLAAPLVLGACQYLPPMPEETGAPVTLREGFSGARGGSGVIRRKHVHTLERFTLAQQGRMAGADLLVAQRFAFDSGLRNALDWRFTPQGPGLWQGSRADLVGTARVTERDGMVWFSYLADFAHPAGIMRWGFEEVLYRRPDGALVLDGVLSEGSTPALNLRVVLHG